jgi:hypothetical protein
MMNFPKQTTLKSKFFLLLFLLMSTYASGQLQVNAGNDTILCLSPWDTIEIGGHPAAWGGQEPYLYTWSTNVRVGSQNWGASHFLDDTTKANPKLVDRFYESLTLKLEVRDNSGAVSEDSINVRFSIFYSLAWDFYANIMQGDTIYLAHDIVGGIPPLKFAWSPNYNISDTSISSPLAWPYVDTWYKVIAIDSIGCVSQPCYFDVRIKPSQIPQSTGYQSTLFPNPIDNGSVLYFDVPTHKNLMLKVLDSNGKIIFTDIFLSGSYRIGEKINKSGSYIYVISDGSKIISSGQFIKP